ncbi:HET-domain-containing protein, partial [Hyaloscypha hepaticicola]
MAYAYTPLQGANSIRLLQLESGSYSAPLKARLASSRLEDHCYEALSYVWGEPDLSEVLLVDDKEFKISKNLHTILLHLRYLERIRCVRTLWIDAICINQEDVIEKGQQVGFMGRIYEEADDVLCWLG